MGAGTTTRTAFATSDSPATVRDFSRDRLTHRGVQHRNYTPALDNAALFVRKGCPSHTLTLQSRRVADSPTVATLAHGTITLC